jgi:TolB-like protein
MALGPDRWSTVTFGDFQLDGRVPELKKHGRTVRVPQQPIQILSVLIAAPGKVVTREELRAAVWSPDTHVDFDRGINKAINRLRQVLGDRLERPRFIETVPRHGYRFVSRISDVRALRAGRFAEWRPRLVVLPITGGCGRETFADGLTEELMVQVGRMNSDGVALIARSSAIAFKGGRRQPSEIGQALAVDYLLEGSVRATADRARVVASLVETSTETHIWGDAVECSLAQPIAAQIEVATRLAESLDATLRSCWRPRPT